MCPWSYRDTLIEGPIIRVPDANIRDRSGVINSGSTDDRNSGSDIVSRNNGDRNGHVSGDTGRHNT